MPVYIVQRLSKVKITYVVYKSMEQKSTFHEFCLKLDALIKTVEQEQLFPGSKEKGTNFWARSVVNFYLRWNCHPFILCYFRSQTQR